MIKSINIILQIIIGFLLADIITGMFHWYEDCYFNYCSTIPIINTIAKDNELHHYFPRSIIAYSYFEHISYSLPLVIIILFIIFLINKSMFNYKYIYIIISFAFFSIISNIIHRFAHMRECENNTIINFLQNTGILCSHKHHSAHHTNINEKYCVISEYNNYILDSIYFWRALEYIIFLLTNIKPDRKQSYDDYYTIHNHMHENAKLKCPDKPTRKDVDELIEKLKTYKNCKNTL
jgi:ubiquitin-conjugating enzyme E2 variant